MLLHIEKTGIFFAFSGFFSPYCPLSTGLGTEEGIFNTVLSAVSISSSCLLFPHPLLQRTTTFQARNTRITAKSTLLRLEIMQGLGVSVYQHTNWTCKLCGWTSHLENQAKYPAYPFILFITQKPSAELGELCKWYNKLVLVLLVNFPQCFRSVNSLRFAFLNFIALIFLI